MSHLIKENKNTLNFLRILFYSIIFSILIFVLYFYEGNKINIFIFGILSNLIFYFILSKKMYFFEFFFGCLLWLGFWYKFSIIIIFDNYMFREGAGMYNYFSFNDRIDILDNTVITASYGIAGYLFACFVKNKIFDSFFNFKKDEIKIQILENKRFLILFFSIFGICFFTITISNFFLGIYQRGILSTFDVNFLVSAVYKWLLLFGFSAFIAFTFIFTFKSKHKIYIISSFSIVETFITNLSFLSRGMIFNLFAIFLGLYKSNKLFKLNLNIKFFLIYLFGILFFFYFSVISVNYFRANIFFVKSDIKSLEKNETFEFKFEKKYNTSKKAFTEFLSLSYTRWVGIDALVAVEASDLKSFDFFKESFTDKFDKNKLPFYERKIQKREKNLKNKTVQYGITTPGIIAFLYYSGSKIFIFFSIFTISLIILTIERYIFLIFNNPILCSLLSQVLAYRLIHFGYMPQNTYLLISSFLLTIIGLFIIKKFFFKT